MNILKPNPETLFCLNTKTACLKKGGFCAVRCDFRARKRGAARWDGDAELGGKARATTAEQGEESELFCGSGTGAGDTVPAQSSAAVLPLSNTLRLRVPATAPPSFSSFYCKLGQWQGMKPLT